MDLNQFRTQMQERLNELMEQERIAFINLGKAMGAKEEAQHWLAKLGGDGEGVMPSPTPLPVEGLDEQE